MSGPPIADLKIFWACSFAGLCIHIGIGIYYCIADAIFSRQYPGSKFTIRELDTFWKARHRILPRNGGVPLAGIGLSASMFCILVGLVAQIAYCVLCA